MRAEAGPSQPTGGAEAGAASADDPAAAAVSGDLTSAAYERIEELFISMRLQPGATLRTQDLQELTGLGRTPVHQAVRRLAAETLLDVQPRNGLRVSPIDLARERRLADLRRDMDRFVVGAVIARMAGNERARLHHITRRLEDERATITLDRFNMLDKAFDKFMIQSAGERFLDRCLRPLKALGRRAGFLDITRVSGQQGLDETVGHHLAIMQAVLAGDVARAREMSDRLVEFGLTMLDRLEQNIDPALLDVSFGLDGGQGGRAM
ncbi:GntR family transcriptional regulator [Paracoccus spongiarum]|uniref:GntR family transcriptional regulator n=1 Tax=Paracoccus spongiarum TaxID=3064387 RepID=A0ABT9JFV9_9RHOB|nr:GntR family transcriptional regulator [Paracoccus sp. 2205BS29-5]MDP5308688.1 GntR family transcriptional regulator [Paracoccus sp. 2205BS29-5]